MLVKTCCLHGRSSQSHPFTPRREPHANRHALLPCIYACSFLDPHKLTLAPPSPPCNWLHACCAPVVHVGREVWNSSQVLDSVGKHQVLIFVHSRKETAKTARYLKEEALKDDKLAQFMQVCLLAPLIAAKTRLHITPCDHQQFDMLFPNSQCLTTWSNQSMWGLATRTLCK